MTKTVGVVAALMLAGSAQAAGVLTYSGYLQDAQGKAVTTSTGISFRFYSAAAGGIPMWEDVVTVLPNQDGWFSAVIGATAANPLDAADFKLPLWLALKLTADAAEMSPRMRIGTAPYALTVEWGGVLAKPEDFPTTWEMVKGKPTTFAPGPVEWDSVTNKPTVFSTDWASVAGKPATYPADPVIFQRRVANGCASGSSIRVMNADGTVICQPDNDTIYASGFGLTLSGSTFAVNPAQIQARITGACGAGLFVNRVNQDGSVVCAPDQNSGDITSVTAGSGLSGGGSAGAVTLQLDLSGTYQTLFCRSGQALGPVCPVRTSTAKRLCALTRVTTSGSIYKGCEFGQNADGTWTLYGGGVADCGAVCF